MNHQPTLIVNHKGRGQKVLTTLLDEFRQCSSFQFSVAFITQSGVACLIETLNALAARGVKGRILTSQYLNFTQPHALESLVGFENIELRMMVSEDFHSKGYLFHNSEGEHRLYIGSSNLTQNALTTNIELNVGLPGFKGTDPFLSKYQADFEELWEASAVVDQEFINEYRKIYDEARQRRDEELKSPSGTYQRNSPFNKQIRPNKMQQEALENLEKLRREGKNKALLISATGTGKTFLSAFDVARLKPKRVLFIVHRRTIAQKSLETFELLIEDRSMAIYSGADRGQAEYLFSTVQTVVRDVENGKFTPDAFDYIIVDETHRAEASSYQKILDFFEPTFLLGMTATPERTDGGDIFRLFDHNIAYEIRLQQALHEKMLVPFHYYGVSDLTIDGQLVEDRTEFNKLVSDERVDRIIEKANFYKCDSGKPKGLIFCSRKEEAKELANKLNQKHLRTVALPGESSEEQRKNAIQNLEKGDVDYIITVDIFNEGVDIPSINQVIMLRPTKSAIIFVQQLGRGLRIAKDKEFLTVIDFIGNYANSYLIPIALYGDSSYNKDNLRKLLVGGSHALPGACTIDFDEIAQKQIFDAINRAKMNLRKDLKADYEIVSKVIGRIPLMMDFIRHGSRDPYQFVDYAGSFYKFAVSISAIPETLNSLEIEVLGYLSKLINDGKQLLDSLILETLSTSGILKLEDLERRFKAILKREPTAQEIAKALRSLNLSFDTVRYNRSDVPISQKLGFTLVEYSDEEFKPTSEFQKLVANPTFSLYLYDSAQYSIHQFKLRSLEAGTENQGFLLHEKYSRRDVLRILGWDKNRNATTIGGYRMSPDKSNCPIFVTYHKSDDIVQSVAYEDAFINPSIFQWMSRSNRRIDSGELLPIINARSNGLRLPLFVKKDDNEGIDFYYLGDVKPVDDSVEQRHMPGPNNTQLPVVKFDFELEVPVKLELYKYLTT